MVGGRRRVCVRDSVVGRPQDLAAIENVVLVEEVMVMVVRTLRMRVVMMVVARETRRGGSALPRRRRGVD